MSGDAMLTQDQVREASKRFYEGLNLMANGKNGNFGEVWSQNPKSTAMHPIGGRDLGWDAVKNSFEQVGNLASSGKVELKDQLINVLGDTAYEIGTEHASFQLAGKEVAGEIRVTNIYHLDDGKCKMVHHHTDVAASMVNVLNSLQAAAK